MLYPLKTKDNLLHPFFQSISGYRNPLQRTNHPDTDLFCEVEKNKMLLTVFTVFDLTFISTVIYFSFACVEQHKDHWLLLMGQCVHTERNQKGATFYCGLYFKTT